jgi:hypothetical protein
VIHELELLNSKKFLWISSSKELSADVRKELQTVKSKTKFQVFSNDWRNEKLSKKAPKTDDSENGTVVFTTYSSLRSGKGHHIERANLFAVLQWLGPAYDGLVSVWFLIFFVNKTNLMGVIFCNRSSLTSPTLPRH